MDQWCMMTSSNGNIFRVTGHLCWEFTGPRWLPRTKASDAELWCFLDLRLNKRLSKQSWRWWFETLSHPLWRRCNGNQHQNISCTYDIYIHILNSSSQNKDIHYNDVIKSATASKITSLTIVYSTVYSGADQRKHQSSTSLDVGNSPVTGEFPTQRASDAKNVSIWWRHHVVRNYIP